MSLDTPRQRVARAFELQSTALLAYFVRRVDVPEDAADLLSETALIAWRKRKYLPQSEEDIRAWLFGVARNVLLHHYRTSIRRRAAADRLRDQIRIDSYSGFTPTPATEAVLSAIRELDALDQEIIGLAHWDGLPLVEVARVLRMKEGTVRSRYHRARVRLRDALGAFDPRVVEGASR